MAAILHWVDRFCSNLFQKLGNYKIGKDKKFECMDAIEKKCAMMNARSCESLSPPPLDS